MSDGVVLEGVTKRFGGVTAVSGISAEIRPGRLTGLVGPDGAGKTTLLRLITALLTADQGRITVAGVFTDRDAEAIHRMAGYMPQRFGLYEDLSVRQNLDLYADLRGVPASQRPATYRQLLHFTGLAEFQSRLAGRLSGGMKQKLGLACALMGSPRVLLLDEPSVGVDPVSRRELWSMVRALLTDGLTVVWSTAYLDEAEQCDEVLLMNGGELQFAGAPGELTRRVAGRTFLLTGVAGQRREVLARALELTAVRDGVIQGSAVRLVTVAGDALRALENLAEEVGGRLAAAPPRFEDAFIDHLGGGPGGRSELAEQMAPIPAESAPAVRCRHLSKRFGAFVATDDVSFDVAQGEIFGLLGPNGAGKSTTFKMLCGLLKPTSGSAEVAGWSLRTAPGTAKQNVGYMAQKFSLYGLLTVRQNLELFAGIYGLSGARRRDRIEEMITTFELRRWLARSPDELPLGFKQRLALACALIHSPPVLFLDEPTSGVDPVTRREFWTHINGLVGKGVTVMVTTHFMDEAEYCDRVALMYRGRIIALAPPDELRARAAGAEVPDPTMEQAFVALVEEAERQGAAAGTQA